jgi:hypothetical protein
MQSAIFSGSKKSMEILFNVHNIDPDCVTKIVLQLSVKEKNSQKVKMKMSATQ